MAYSDYGGYAYRDGARVVERSDYTITLDGDGFGRPGMWPGFAAILSGMDAEKAKAMTDLPHGHAVLGDGPIRVVLYKQGLGFVCRGVEKLDALSLVDTLPDGAVREYKDKDGVHHRWLDESYFREHDVPLELGVDGFRLTVWFADEDNSYVYARLEQPDGHVWHGWSGYGVGAGLEDCDYGFSTEDRERTLCRLWPDAIKSSYVGTEEGAACNRDGCDGTMEVTTGNCSCHISPPCGQHWLECSECGERAEW